MTDASQPNGKAGKSWPHITPGESVSKKGRHRKISFQRVKDWVELFGIISGVAVGFLIYLQYREMQDTRMEDERAWVLLTNQFDFLTEDDCVNVFISYENTGKTPAINVNSVVNYTFDESNIPAADNFTTNVVPQSLCVPDQRNNVVTVKVPKGEYDRMKKGAGLFIYGTIGYDDIFGKHHWSQFCLCLRGRVIDGTQHVSASADRIHNACDNQRDAGPG